MGAINYFTSNYITLGYNCDDIDYNDQFYYNYVSSKAHFVPPFSFFLDDTTKFTLPLKGT